MNIRYPIYEGVYRILTQHRVLRICLQYAVTGGLPQYEGLPPLNREETSATGNR